MEIKIENYPLTYVEKRKFDDFELEVIRAYEYYTKNKFMRFDVIILKRLIKVATPKQIISQICKYAKSEKYKDNFINFAYIESPVTSMFRNRRGGKKDEE